MKATQPFHLNAADGSARTFLPGEDVPDDVAAIVGPHLLDVKQPEELPPPTAELRLNGVPTAANVAARAARWLRYAPVHLLHQTRVPSALADVPVFRQLAEERDALRRAELHLQREHQAWQSRVQLAQAEHENRSREALLDGAEPPAPLKVEPWRYPVNTRAVFDDVHRVIEAEEQGRLVEQSDEWLGLLERRLAPHAVKIEKAERALERSKAAAAPLRTALAALPTIKRVEFHERPSERIRAAELRNTEQMMEELRRRPVRGPRR